MTHAIRRFLTTRRGLRPAVDRLEDRALMNATPVTHHASTLVQLLGPAEHAIHASSTAHSQPQGSALHASTAYVKAPKLSAPAKHAFHVPVRDLTNLVFNPRKALGGGGPVAGAFAPSQLETAYTVSALGIQNQGQGQTIGIVDALYDPTIVNDANFFSAHYGLQQFNVSGGPTLTVVKDSALGVVGNSPLNGGDTSVETSLDVEWAHAMAPKANILMIFVPSPNIATPAQQFNYLLHGVQLAAADGASVVSLSYGYPETNILPAFNYPFIDLPAIYAQNQQYLASAPVSNIAVTVSSGDHSDPLFPSVSSNVISVGGTALHLTSSGQYSFETAWGGPLTSGAGGGGTSAFFSTPSYQSGNNVNYIGKRAVPDIALNADPFTGVSVYDSYAANINGSAWTDIGGTSEASPLFAGILALAQQDRATAGHAPLTSAQIHTALYGLYNSPSYSTYFHDVTLGMNGDASFGFAGYAAGSGYDRATGIGSPIAQRLVPYLAGI